MVLAAGVVAELELGGKALWLGIEELQLDPDFGLGDAQILALDVVDL